ncbi:hypothetical protein E1A91_D05G270100v1 [Gossypium mustelinum]|uniref:Pectinesterase inhibitor domain-containing protein n=3 Tax=Gossypium TaxID=3633 RepID=A0A5J5RME6_GOSBA|nr:hypothetical protein ES319_D05G263900v1 [Gossypium barbadense]PPD88545.1 hypothetical protein GOBAR_DD14527 [Gossypium barbadense]TYG70016.1 hypothetical protein ES288_D05G278300v1 [Gossypium darwinii]TYI83128.1 hypothetical protein E1A91_D05G270100v1 [Gossypium mustelinum]
MAPPNHYCFFSTIFLFLFLLSFSPTSAILPKVNVRLPVTPSKLVKRVCKGDTIDRNFCLQVLTTPEAVAVKDPTKLGTLIMQLGAANGKATLDAYNEMIKKPGSPQTLKALNSCVEAYKYAIQSFKMVSTELVDDPMTANYDVSILAPEITNCEKALTDAKVEAPRLYDGNRFIKYYIAMGSRITSILEDQSNQNNY